MSPYNHGDISHGNDFSRSNIRQLSGHRVSGYDPEAQKVSKKRQVINKNGVT
jgi:hypothetical protein